MPSGHAVPVCLVFTCTHTRSRKKHAVYHPSPLVATCAARLELLCTLSFVHIHHDSHWTLSVPNILARSPSGHKLPAIENLGVTKDQLDSIDFTDNSITSVSNFPLLRRLSHLLLANNPVRTISATLATSLPNLRTLILTNGALPLDSLALLGEVLGKCRKLETLCCKGCPVVGAEYYKEWIVFKCKKLRSLDFERIKDKVRSLAGG